MLKEWDDIESDMSVLHRIDDLENYHDSARAFRLIYRLPHYKGVMRSRIEIKANEEQAQEQTPAPTKARTLRNPKPADAAFFFNNDIPVEQVDGSEKSYLHKKLEGQ